MKCKPIIEQFYSKEHSDGARNILARLYDRLSVIYDLKHDEQSQKLSSYYNELSINVLRSISDSQIVSSHILMNLAVINLKKAEKLVKNSKTITSEIIDCYSEVFKLLQQMVNDFNSEEAYEYMDKAYCCLMNDVRTFYDIETGIIKRVVAEIDAQRLKMISDTIKKYDDIYRKYIVQHAEVADLIVESAVENKNGNEIPDNLSELLSVALVEPSDIYEPAHVRAFEILKNAMKMCDLLVENTGLISDYDILAVTLTKYTTISATAGNAELFNKNVERLSKVAHYLYKETNDEKYMMMIALSHMLPDLFDK